jgi:predicted amidohydrolase
VLRVSVLELPARWAQAEEALREVGDLVARGPTDLVVLPEMSLVGYVSPAADFDLTRFAEPIDGPTVHACAEISTRHGVHLVAPLVLAEGGHVYNASIVLGPNGRVVATYRKRHPWFPERWATPGPLPPPVFEVRSVRTTLAICYDGHFLAEDGADVLSCADLLVFTSAWVDEEDSRMPLLRSLARRFGVSIANANWSQGVVEVPGQGGSCILDPNGRTLAEVAPGDRRADAIVQRRRIP